MQLLRALNEAQQQAVKAEDGVVLIVAGPGTGKTKTLTARIAYLLDSGRAQPNDVIALTFTNKAAREMHERLGALLGPGAAVPQICTFHALGADLLRQYGSERELASAAEQQEIIQSLQKPAAYKSKGLREIGLLLSNAKTSLHAPSEEATSQLLERYTAALAGRGLYDFDDLLIQTYEYLRGGKATRYKYVLVDEFQDTSDLQYEILKLLGSAGNIFAIGDPNQSIYAFRGAGAATFVRLQQDYPDAKHIDLTANYRSRPEIVRLANAVFPDSPQLKPQVVQSGRVQVLQTLNEYSEAAYIVQKIEEGIGGSTMLSATGHTDAREPRDYAVLYRTHRAAQAAVRAFAESGVPYQVVGEGSPYERADVQTVIAELRTAPNDDSLPVHNLARHIAERHGLHSDQLTQFLGLLVQFGADLTACLRHIETIAEQGFYDPTVNAVTLSTIHASKGLEFAQVFLLAAEEGVLPKISRGTVENAEEERRLFYVAATRAKETFEILHAKRRAGEPAELSRFVQGLSEQLLPRVIDPDLPSLERRAQKRAAKRAQTSLF